MMLAKTVERDVLENDHLFVRLLEPSGKDLQRVLEEPGEQLPVHFGDALGSAEEPFAHLIFADGVNDLAYGADDALLVHSGGCGSHLWLTVLPGACPYCSRQNECSVIGAG